jgi:hypothetical protein
MQFGNSFSLTDFDATIDSESNANTIFLYPTSTQQVAIQSFIARDQRKTSPTGTTPADNRSDTPVPIYCQESLPEGGYACTTLITLPEPIGGGDRTAFLRLTPLYNDAHFRVTLLRSGTVVNFNGVQPKVDSTGRANDLFRRVVSRVDLIDTSFPYPEAAVEVTGNFCKDFSVTDTQYFAGSCTP